MEGCGEVAEAGALCGEVRSYAQGAKKVSPSCFSPFSFYRFSTSNFSFIHCHFLLKISSEIFSQGDR